MGFSNAYYIPRTETKVYANGTSVDRMPDEFKKYQLLRTAALFGLNISHDSKFPNKIMISNGKNITFVLDGQPIPDHVYIDYMMKLKEAYNQTRRYCLAGTNLKITSSSKFETFLPTKDMPAEEAYLEEDPLFYSLNLIKDLERAGKTEKANMLKKIVKRQFACAISALSDTKWGTKPLPAAPDNNMKESLTKFYLNNRHQFKTANQSEIEIGLE